jgi:hypothetical protein
MNLYFSSFFLLLLLTIAFTKTSLQSQTDILNSESQNFLPIKWGIIKTINNYLPVTMMNLKTLGNIWLLVVLDFDLIQGVTASGISATPIEWSCSSGWENNYPSLMTYIGIAAVIIAIPVKSGFLIKLKCSLQL